MTTDPSGSAAMPENPAASDIPPSSDQAPPSVSDASTHGVPDEDGAPSDECEPGRSDGFGLVEPGSNFDAFEQVCNAGMTRALSRLAHNTAASDISQFTSFDDGAISVTSGQFSLTVDRDRLCLAIVDVCEAARMPVRSNTANYYCVRLCISRFEIKLTAFDPCLFFETTIPTVAPVSGIADGQKIAAEVNLRQLKKLARSAGPDENLTAVYDAGRQSLIIRSGALSASPLRRHFEARGGGELAQRYQLRLGPPRQVQRFDPLILQTAVKFGRLFAQRDSARPAWPHVGIREGVALAMLPNRVGMLTSDKLKGLHLGIRYDYMDRLAYLLGHFEPSTTYLFDTAYYHVFYDGATCLGFEKAVPAELPPLSPIFTGNCRSRIIVPRSTLLSDLCQLEPICSSDRHRDFLVTLRIEGWPGARLYLQTRDGASHGVGVTDCTRIIRGEGISGEGISGRSAIYKRSFSLQTLCEVISHFQSANVVLEELREGNLRIQDEAADFRATSWIASVEPA